MKKDSKSHLLELLPNGSLYDILPELVAATLDYGEFYIAQSGERIANEGDEIKYFTLPIDENIKLLKTDGDEEKSIGFLQRKRSLALGELIFNTPYTYSAVCETPTRILRLEKTRFLKILAENKKVDYYLKLIVQSSGLRSFKVFLEEKGLQKNQIIEIFNKIVLQDQKILQDEHINIDSEKLYFIKSGELEADFVKTDIQYRKLKLYKASFFGGEALLPPYRTSYQIKAITDTTYHFAAVKDILPELERYDVINEMHKEPWVTKRAKAKRVNPWKGMLTESFGEVITASELKKLDHLKLDKHFDACKSDKHSFYLNIVNLAKLLDIDINPNAIENQIIRNELISPLRVCNIFEDYPAIAQNTKGSYKDIKDINKPFLFIFNNRLNIYLHTNRQYSYVLDTAIGIVKIKTAEIFKDDIDIIIINKNQNNSELRSNLKLFLSPLKNTKKLFFPIVFLLVFTFVLGLLQPYFLQLMMDEALMLKDMKTILSLGGALILLLFFATASNMLLQVLFREVSIDYDKKLSSIFYKSSLNKPLSFFQKNNTGEILSRFYELENIRNMVSIDTMQALIDASSILVYSLILFAYDAKLALMPFIFLGLCFVIQSFYLKRLKRNNEKAFKLVSHRNSLVTEVLKNITSLKFVRAQKSLKDKWEKSLIDFLKLKRLIQNENALLGLLLDIGTFVIQIVTIWVAVLLSMEGSITTGAIVAISIYVGKATVPIRSINMFFLKTQRAALAFEKVGDIVEDEVKPRDISTNHFVNLRGKIKLERVFYRYKDNTPWNLNDINITIHPGQCLAIVGPSGCGKTTLAKVIARQIKPNSGRIFYDDYDSEFLTSSCLHNQITLVEQDSNLFTGTIEDNVVIDDSYVSELNFDDALNIAQAKGIDSIVKKDFNNKITTGGRSLSMGQRQRIAIARAVYRKPSCMVMDEMTSALDPFTEKKVFEQVREHLVGTTQVIISHKKSAIKNADQIIVMDKGSIVEHGTHDDLIAKEGLYARLFN